MLRPLFLPFSGSCSRPSSDSGIHRMGNRAVPAAGGDGWWVRARAMHAPRREQLLLVKRNRQSSHAHSACHATPKELFSLAQEAAADCQPPAKHHSVALGSTRGAESPQSHHPGLPLTHEEELQAPGCLPKLRGSTGKHQYPSKHPQKPSSIPRVRVSPGARAA